VEISLKKIESLAKEREDENWSFRSFLKGYDVKNFDKTVHKLFVQVSEAIDCTACGNCCKKIKPNLEKKDINKLSSSLNITPGQFITRYVDKDEAGDRKLNQLPCPFLKDNKCTQYESRPIDCASYPHLQKKDFVFRLISVVNNYSICPIVFNVYEGLKGKLKSEFIEFQEDFGDFEYY
jgi:Fe-S-cluster containining protein